MSLIMTITMLVGCGGKENDEGNNNNDKNNNKSTKEVTNLSTSYTKFLEKKGRKYRPTTRFN